MKKTVNGRKYGLLPWEKEFRESTPLEKLAESTYHEWYDAKHRRKCIDEVRFINSLNVYQCPFCLSKDIYKDGFTSNKIQRYKCSTCKRRFKPLSGTLFDSCKIPLSEWFEFLTGLLEFHSTKSTSSDNRNAKTTGYYWIFKVFEALENYQDNIILRNEVWLDETYWSIDKDKRIYKNGLKLRGISRNKVCLLTATDRRRLVILISKGNKPSLESTLQMSKYIKEGSILHHDGDNGHTELIKKNKLKSVVHKTADTKKLKDKNNPMDPINNIHSFLKIFLRSHSPFQNDKLQGYVNLFVFKFDNIDWPLPEQAMKLLQKMVSTYKRRKYREFYAKKDDEDDNN